jgi:hypothetical protein
MRKLVCVLALAGVLTLGTVATATASHGKSSQTINASCTVLGTVNVHASSGASAWVNNDHYVLVKLTGTFTPVSGPPMTFTKTYGHKTGLKGTRYSCTGAQSDSTGTFSFTAWVTRTGLH